MDEYKLIIKGANRYSKYHLDSNIDYLDRFAIAICDMYDYLKKYEANVYVRDLIIILNELALCLRKQFNGMME